MNRICTIVGCHLSVGVGLFRSLLISEDICEPAPTGLIGHLSFVSCNDGISVSRLTAFNLIEIF